MCFQHLFPHLFIFNLHPYSLAQFNSLVAFAARTHTRTHCHCCNCEVLDAFRMVEERNVWRVQWMHFAINSSATQLRGLRVGMIFVSGAMQTMESKRMKRIDFLPLPPSLLRYACVDLFFVPLYSSRAIALPRGLGHATSLRRRGSYGMCPFIIIITMHAPDLESPQWAPYTVSNFWKRISKQ